MKISDLIHPELICLDLNSTTKHAVFNEMAEYLFRAGKIHQPHAFVQEVLKREATGNTGFEGGVALPHAKCASVLSPAVMIGISREGIDYGAEDDKPTHLLLMIASPERACEAHIEILAQLSARLVDDDSVSRILACRSEQEVIDYFCRPDEAGEEAPSSRPSRGLIIGVTGCPVGIAHTYLAAEMLEKAAAEMGYEAIVETNGSIGVKNAPTPGDIARAEAIVVACDKQVDLHRFSGKKVVITGVKAAIKDAKGLIQQALASTPQQASATAKTAAQPASSAGSQLYKSLMNGVSYMIPFVVTGGLMIALSLALGGVPTASGLAIPEGSLWNQVLNVGVVGFTLMIPVLAGYIAYAIGERPALAPGFIGGWIANTGTFYGASAGCGFIGAIIAGLLVGYFIKWLTHFSWHKMLQPLVPIMIAPIAGTAFIAALFIFVIGAPVADLMAFLNHLLTNLSTGNIILIGLVMGLMQGFDMGGPFGKVVFMFSVGLIAQGQTQFMGAQAAAIPVAPLGMALAAFIGKRFNLFDEEEYENGKAAAAMGLVGISEGAIPFAARDPLSVIPANMIGSAVACVLGFVFGLNCNVAHGGPIIVLLGGFDKPLMALLAMVCGTITTAVIAIALKRLKMAKKQQILIQSQI
ncbi:PTS fructose transporter subunit IIABC [[Enterobacter] lignolyticus]|uniref:protein-N(pi)-phosphohistidine--D-fructose phosphotransferase n=1 Tax=Enterobacter lignolyticus (strain SCF1) TaxID=701347 RepID=E3G1J3_ENTLS|nr:fructose-specific PTS transporter subunit EIIC [[Enterobacter] lignolyticus]ADO50278.1 PTS system, fructose subfamily, IIC subunit [[Enterobacter] lignolyticus SCF1]